MKSPSTGSVLNPAVKADSFDTLSHNEIEVALKDSLLPDSNYDAITAQLLERARQHYLSALEAEQENDSIHAANEFEYSIGILNELGYYPNIETNCDFNDLSHSVIEDYQKYIALIDSLGPNTSIFALRNKLDQIDESNVGADQDKTKEIITTTSIPLIINGHVEQNISFFQGRGKPHFEHWLYESGKYFPLMRKVFRDAGVPEELVYLSMIESGMNPVARSWARAVGLWQFVKGTGQLYGLHSNFWIDERRDFRKATMAAAHHLKDLYSEFGDWYLVLAAYNSGAGRVNSAMRRSKSSDFWRMRPFLPRETRNYVPQYIAAAVMSLNPAKYGFDVAPAKTMRYDTVGINDCVDLTVLAKCAGTDAQTLRELNPELVQWCTPPGENGYVLHIPVGSAASFAVNYSNVPDEQKRDWVEHKVKRRESLAAIAKRYGVPASLIANANHLKANRLPVGKSIVIPVPGAGKHYLAALADESPRKSSRKNGRVNHSIANAGDNKTKLTYKIRKGDTLGKIAEWYDVRISDLRVWNEIPYGSSIRAGNVLTVWVPYDHVDNYSSIDHLSDTDHEKLIAGKSRRLDIVSKDNATSRSGLTEQDSSKAPGKTISYRVKKGDTLLRIASNFGVSIRQLRNWNNLRGKRIHVGQEILINS